MLRKPDVPSVIAQRHAVDRWFEKFDAIALQLGYAKKPAARSMRAPTVAGALTAIGVLLS